MDRRRKSRDARDQCSMSDSWRGTRTVTYLVSGATTATFRAMIMNRALPAGETHKTGVDGSVEEERATVGKNNVSYRSEMI